MNTKEEIIDQYKANTEYPSYYHVSNVLDAMESYANQRLYESKSEIEELRRENEFNKGKVKLMTNAFEAEVEICKGFRELLEEKEKEKDRLKWLLKVQVQLRSIDTLTTNDAHKSMIAEREWEQYCKLNNL